MSEEPASYYVKKQCSKLDIKKYFFERYISKIDLRNVVVLLFIVLLSTIQVLYGFWKAEKEKADRYSKAFYNVLNNRQAIVNGELTGTEILNYFDSLQKGWAYIAEHGVDGSQIRRETAAMETLALWDLRSQTKQEE